MSNYFPIAAAEVAAGLWKVRWSSDLETIDAEGEPEPEPPEGEGSTEEALEKEPEGGVMMKPRLREVIIDFTVSCDLH